MLRVRRAPFRGVGLLKRAVLRVLQADGSRYALVRNWAERTCNICGFHGEFRPGGLYAIQPDHGCPGCKSMPRSRLLAMHLEAAGPPVPSPRVLHVAPEPALRRVLEPIAGEYVTADLAMPGVDHAWDIQAIDCPDGRFDLVVCSHVLEHVDAEQALRELRRVLSPGGAAWLMVPICEGLDETYRNPDVDDDLGRWMHFQQADHVQVFGRDFRDLVRGAGFDLTEVVATGPRAVEHGLTLGERVFVARVPGAVAGG